MMNTMQAQDLVDAALIGLDAGELVTFQVCTQAKHGPTGTQRVARCLRSFATPNPPPATPSRDGRHERRPIDGAHVFRRQILFFIKNSGAFAHAIER